jgi:uncharacterized delta-60 repeat protein
MTRARRTVLTGSLVSGMLAALVVTAPPGGAAPPTEGALDPGWSGDGIELTPVGSSGGGTDAIAQQADGKVVVAVYETGGGIAVIRYTRNGAVDDTFGGGGIAEIPNTTDIYGPNAVLGGVSPSPTGIAVDSAGRIVVTGSVGITGDPGDIQDAVVARFLPSGTLDDTFDGDGVAVIDLDNRYDQPTAVLVRPNNKIVVVGYLSGGGVPDDSVAMQLTEGGALDSAFDGDGYQLVNPQLSSGHATTPWAAALGPAGTLVMAGIDTLAGQDQMLLARLTSSGAFDHTFSTDGILIRNPTPDFDEFNAVKVRSDGVIIAAGVSDFAGNQDAVVVRVKPGGAVDGAFGDNGLARTGVVSTYDTAYGVAIQRDGKIVIVGSIGGGGHAGSDTLVARFNGDGSLDPQFGTTGVRRLVLDNDASVGYAVTVQRNGRILVAGEAGSSAKDPLVAGIVGDATPPSKARLRGVHRWSLTKTTIRWRATDDNTGVKSYEVQRRAATYKQDHYGTWSLWKSTTLTRATFRGKPGHTYCFHARARDYAGNRGAYGTPACTSVPLDDRALGGTASWTQLSDAGYYRGTAVTTTQAGDELRLRGAKWRHLAVLATTCPTCGKLRVYLGRTLLTTLDLHSATTRHGRVLAVAHTKKVREGRIRLVQQSAGKQVTVEGLGISLA